MRPMHIGSIVEIKKGGWRPVIMGLLGEGLSVEAIRSVLLEEYEAEVSAVTLRRYIDTLGGSKALIEVVKRRDSADLNRIAMANLENRLEKYEEVEQSGSLEHMKFYDDSAGKWFDKLAKVSGSYKDVPQVAVQNNIGASLEQIMGILKENPEKAETVIDVVRNGGNVDEAN